MLYRQIQAVLGLCQDLGAWLALRQRQGPGWPAWRGVESAWWEDGKSCLGSARLGQSPSASRPPAWQPLGSNPAGTVPDSLPSGEPSPSAGPAQPGLAMQRGPGRPVIYSQARKKRAFPGFVQFLRLSVHSVQLPSSLTRCQYSNPVTDWFCQHGENC